VATGIAVLSVVVQSCALTLTITGESYRGVRARKFAGSHKDE
jgi:hypothetical protein